MQILRLNINNFRNYDALDISFDPELNILIGDNAQGKSNILEAISYLGLTFSFRDAEDREMIAFGASNFFIEGQIINNSGEKNITAAYSMEKRKLWTIDGVQKHRLNDVFGNFYTVTFSPEDLSLVKRSPDIRRKFLNREMMQLYPEYCISLSRFNKVLRQRNALLKDEVNTEQLEPWTVQLCDLAADISIKRYNFINKLNYYFTDAQSQISDCKEDAKLKYISFYTDEQLKSADKNALSNLLHDYFKQNSIQERARKITVAGPQKDDFIFSVNGFNAKAFASQGQQRSLVLSLKLAQLKTAESILGETPVLLLDDVLSELDSIRSEKILKLMSANAQTFITGTENNSNYNGGKLFYIKEGKVCEVI